MSDRLFRKELFNALQDGALEPDDPRYVQLYEDGADVIADIRETIDFLPESTQLLSGYRGTGKSTELKRLRRDLQRQGYLVVLIDIEDFLDLSTPVDVTDFLLGVAGAVGTALQAEELLGHDALADGIWRRLTHWLQREVAIKELGGKIKDPGTGAELALKAELKGNPTFRQRLQAHLAGVVGRLTEEVHAYLSECLGALRRRHSDAANLVLLVDSIEHARGTSSDEAEVHAGLERLFAQHDDKLRVPGLHLVYTVPPWLRVQRPNLGSLYDGEGLYTLPTQKVRLRGEGEALGPVHAPGVDRLVELVSHRGDWRRLLGSEAVLRDLILTTGGHLRDLVRLLGAVTVRSRSTLPAGPEVIAQAVSALREQLLPIPRADARWLATIARTHQTALLDLERMGTLARYFDGHLVLSYRNGEAWYDVHPLVRDHVLAEAELPDAH